MANKVIDGDEVIPIFQYLHFINKIDGMKCKATRSEDFLDLDLVQELLTVQVCFKVKRII